MDIDAYATALSSLKPASFIPDVAPQAPAAVPSTTQDQASDTTAATSFRDTVKSLLGGVNDKMQTAGQDSVDFATGKSNDFEGTVKAVEQASLAFQMTMSVRNKLLDAYQEIQQMQF